MRPDRDRKQASTGTTQTYNRPLCEQSISHPEFRLEYFIFSKQPPTSLFESSLKTTDELAFHSGATQRAKERASERPHCSQLAGNKRVGRSNWM